jgi:antitoxin PrlF
MLEVGGMRWQFRVVTRKGQVTVPAEIRRALGLKEGDRVAFVLEGSQVRLQRAGSVVELTAGMLRGEGMPLAPEDLREAAERAMAHEALSRT